MPVRSRPRTIEARAIEGTHSGLRLLTGEDVVDLVLRHYAALPPALAVPDAADLGARR